MAAIPSYRAEMIGLSERDRTLLRSFLAASQARTGVRWDGGTGQPAVWFIDVDGHEGAEFWQSLAAAERRDAAIVVSTLRPADGVRWLPKPLRSSSLIGLLEGMIVAPRPAAVAAPARPAAKQITPIASASPHDGPQDLLDILEGPASTTARAVQSSHWPDIVLGGSHTHAMRTAPLDAYAEGFAASLEVGRVAKYTGGPLDDDLRTDIATLRWLALLYAPIAEVERRLPFPARVRLSKLPAFGQLPHKLHHVRLAAWLVQHPATPQELADMVGIDEETVQRFLGACAAVGLLEEAPEDVPAPPPVMQAPPPVARVASQPPMPVAEAARTANEAVAAASAKPASTAGADDEQTSAATSAAEETGDGDAASPTPAPAEAVSVLERLRASREQNRARVAAAIREISHR